MMDAALRTLNHQEVVHEGWLIKSPPSKLWKARWRERWFTLRHSGELPGQYFLEYYTDGRCRKLKGKIDLDQCEQVDAGLSFENRKEKYQHMFNIKTPKRIYYLVAENESVMNKWVDAICQVCGLKAYTQDDDQQSQVFSFDTGESPPISPTSTLSNPYIPISECISGPRPIDDNNFVNHHHGVHKHIDHYDATKRLMPTPPRSPTITDADSVITDDESLPSSLPNVNWDTFPSAGDLKPNFKSKKRFGKLKTEPVVVAAPKQGTIPPRPPKPSHNYLNLDGVTENAKPSALPTPTQLSNDLLNNSSSTPLKTRQVAITKADVNTLNKLQKLQQNTKKILNTDDHVFRYDFDNNVEQSDVSSVKCSNLSMSPSNKDKNNAVPMIIVPPPPPPPLVNRGLKPGRKTSDSNQSHELSPTVSNKDASELFAEPPSINRRLKPAHAKSPDRDLTQLDSPSVKRKTKPIPSPIMMSKLQKGRLPSVSDDENVFDEKEKIYYYHDNENQVPASNRNLVILQYVDLDLDTDNANSPTVQQQQSPLATTVYKTVDFVKTEAFNRTRQRVEEERKQCNDELT
ncbi:GRB2-associated-binding protein 2-like [Copidosoma floridanum]|uniref:GRB2-associated-binding protein 2-like n=1 Tax=Copidosoma floridanum TaxID=29053 RepID=UPI0006C985DD|nr:GRB2-associated-binding protein 2-like [Copidosoma floridanum]